MLQKRNVTFMSDLRVNGSNYAVTLIAIAFSYALTTLGASSWVAVLLPVVGSAGLGLILRHRRR
jgi:hypothetical protein